MNFFKRGNSPHFLIFKVFLLESHVYILYAGRLQGEVINCIQHHIDCAGHHVERGARQVEQASHLKESINRVRVP